MPLYYFFYAGFPGNVPQAEIRSLLRQHNYQYISRCTAGRVEILEITPPLDFGVLDLCAFKNLAGEVLAVNETSSLNSQALDTMLAQVDWKTFTIGRTGRTWAVRVKGNRDYFDPRELKSSELSLAEKINTLWPYPVQLRQAEIHFQLIVDKTLSGLTILCFGVQRYKQSPAVKQRLSRTLALRRPYFSIGTMNNPISHVVANLSETPPGHILLDPFCGSGGILIESALNGNYCLGIDVDRIVIRGAHKNLRYFAPNMRLGEVRASALALPLRSYPENLGNNILGVSTDLPYGRSTSTQGLGVVTIWEGFLRELHRTIVPGSKCCLVVPNTEEVHVFMTKVRQDARFNVIDTCTQVVHDSLTRLFVVLQLL